VTDAGNAIGTNAIQAVIAGGGARKTALRTDCQLIKRNMLCCFLDPVAQGVDSLEARALAADETKHDAFAARHEAQRCEVPRPRRIVFEQEVVGPGAGEEALRNRLVSALAEIPAAEISPTHVHADDHIRGTG
jgi:hypothetical protein